MRGHYLYRLIEDKSRGQAILLNFFGHIDVILRKMILNTIVPFGR